MLPVSPPMSNTCHSLISLVEFAGLDHERTFSPLDRRSVTVRSPPGVDGSSWIQYWYLSAISFRTVATSSPGPAPAGPAMDLATQMKGKRSSSQLEFPGLQSLSMYGKSCPVK